MKLANHNVCTVSRLITGNCLTALPRVKWDLVAGDSVHTQVLLTVLALLVFACVCVFRFLGMYMWCVHVSGYVCLKIRLIRKYHTKLCLVWFVVLCNIFI